jgi:hypothetical protein
MAKYLLDLPDGLRTRVKVYSYGRNQTMNDVILTAINNYLDGVRVGTLDVGENVDADMEREGVAQRLVEVARPKNPEADR